MSMFEKMAAAQAAIRKLKEDCLNIEREEERKLGDGKKREMHALAENRREHMKDFLFDVLQVYRGKLEEIEFERRQAGPRTPLYRRLEAGWKESEELNWEMFKLQLEVVRSEFRSIFQEPPKRRKKLRKRRR